MPNNGTAVGNPTYVADTNPAFGQAIQLDGATQYVTIPEAALNPAGGSGHAIRVRFKTSSSSGVQVIVGNQDIGFVGLQNGVLFCKPTGYSNTVGGGPSVADATYHEVEYNVGASSTTIFLDGALVATVTGTYTPSGQTNTWAVGQFYTNGNGFFFNGAVSEVAFFSAVQHTANYTPATAPVANNAPGLTALYHFDGDATDSYVASSGTTMIALTDTNLLFSPYNWTTEGTTKRASNVGAYGKAAFSGSTPIKLGVDTSMFPTGTLAQREPKISWSIDGGAWQTYQLAIGDTQVALGTGTTVEFHLIASDANLPRYTNPTMVLKITGFVVNAGVTSVITAAKPKKGLHFGDSITEAAWSLGPPSENNYTPYQDVRVSYVQGLARSLNAEYGICAFGGQSWDVTWNNDVPPFPQAWPNYFQGVSRLVNGVLSPTPDYVTVCMGANGGVGSLTTVRDWIIACRAAVGSQCKIIVIVPFAGNGRDNITAGVAVAKLKDSNVYLIDLGNVPNLTQSSGPATKDATDGLHPNAIKHGWLDGQTSATVAIETAPPKVLPIFYS